MFGPMERIREELEDRIEARSLFVLAVVAWISVEVFNTASEQFAAALFVAEGSTLLPAALGLIGAWLALDGVQSLRHAGLDASPERSPTGKEVYRQYLARRIRELLRERPRSRSELCEAMDAEDETVDSVLADLREQDLIAIEAGVYRATTPSDPGALERIRRPIEKSARRLARPVAVEFGADAYGEGTDAAGGDDHGAGGLEKPDARPHDEPAWGREEQDSRENDRVRSERTDLEHAE
jgi:hypothetical protein